ncbi:MAG TPA: protein kinase [Gemmatimonadaceae bacterium]
MAEAKIPDIGKYHIIELVGEGAMGVVYRAVDSVLDRPVAIKVMNEAIARQEDLRKRFLHEAQAAASLQHPNVVTIYDLGDFNGHLFIAMEFVQGVDLEKLLEIGEPLTLQARLDIVIDVLTGLTFAHKRGIVHRDIKPANIRVTEEGRAKIMDFGVAHLASSSMTSTGSFLGTPSYMAPEQITEGKTTPATDLFAVGGVLYQLLTGMKPFDAPTLQNLFFRIITDEPRKISELMPGLPVALDRIVQKAMAKDPAQRYTSALEMANDLSAVRAKLSGPAYPESVSLSASVSGAIEMARQKSVSRNRYFAYGGAAALVVAVFLVAWSTARRSSGASSTASTTPAVETRAGVGAATVSPSSTGMVSTQAAAPAVQQSAAPPIPVPQPPATKQQIAQTSRTTRTVTPPARTPARNDPPKVTTRANQVAVVSAPPPTQPVVQNPIVQQQLTQSAPAVVPHPLPTPPRDSSTPTPSPATAADISPTVQAYARAIESKDIGAIRRVYPGLTGEQQRGFEAFFQAARSINVTFSVANVDGTPTTADARLVGSYEYVTTSGKSQREPVSFAASLRREGGGWRLVSVR